MIVSPDAPIAEAVALLYTKKIGALLAVEDGKLVGILTVNDMLGLLNELLSGSQTSSEASSLQKSPEKA
jgi:CBS domain-containing protein